MRVLFIALLAACSDVAIDRDEAGYCAAAWAAHGADDTFVCEPGCAAPPDEPGSSGGSCTASHAMFPGVATCTTTFEDDGMRGCCMISASDRRVSFWQCQ